MYIYNLTYFLLFYSLLYNEMENNFEVEFFTKFFTIRKPVKNIRCFFCQDTATFIFNNFSFNLDNLIISLFIFNNRKLFQLLKQFCFRIKLYNRSPFFFHTVLR